MKVLTRLVEGPFKNEQEFKQAVLEKWQQDSDTHFEIENEEKEPGMPDVLSMSAEFPACFTEFKYADKNGVITFTKSQPHFYKRHYDLLIEILAWDQRYSRIVIIESQEVVRAKALRIQIPEVIK